MADSVPFNPFPSVQPTEGMPGRQQINADARSFGGLIAQSLEQGGSKIEKGAEDLQAANLAQQRLYNHTAAAQQTAAFNDAVSDDWEKVNAMPDGPAKMKEIEAFRERTRNQYKANIDAAPSDEAKNLFAQQGTYTASRYNTYSGAAAAKAQRAWTNETDKALLLSWRGQAQTAIINDDPRSFKQYMDMAIKKQQDLIKEKYGYGPMDEAGKTEMDQVAKEERGQIVAGAIKARLQLGDIHGANKLYDGYKNDIDASSQTSALNDMHSTFNAMNGQKIADEEMGRRPQAPLDQRLIRQESGGDAHNVNQFGYAGLYQFGAERLKDVGVYTPGPTENLSNWSRTGARAPGKWSGTFNIPGHPEVKTINDFLNNPEAQQVASQLHFGKMDQEIQQAGLDRFIGQTIGGYTITRDGIKAMMHLGGVGGAQQALMNPANSPRDANGTSVISYARFGQGVARDRAGQLEAIQERTRDNPALEASAVKYWHEANMVEDAKRVDYERSVRMMEQEKKQNSQAAEDDIIKKVDGNKEPVSAQDVALNPNLLPEAKTKMLNYVNRANRPDPPAQVSSMTAKGLTDAMRRNPDDPAKLKSEAPIWDAYNRGDMSKDDFNFVMKQYKNSTEGGEELPKIQANFLDKVKPSIEHANPMLGKMDPEGALKFYEYERFVSKQVEDYRAAGKNPRELLDPSNSNYLGKPEVLAQFQKTQKQSMDTFLSNLRRQQGLPTTTTPAAGTAPQLAPPVTAPTTPIAAPPIPKKPGETPEQYFQRIKENAL